MRKGGILMATFEEVIDGIHDQIEDASADERVGELARAAAMCRLGSFALSMASALAEDFKPRRRKKKPKEIDG